MLHFIISLIIGGISGWIAGQLMGSKHGTIVNIILGLVGGAVGGFLEELVATEGFGFCDDLLDPGQFLLRVGVSTLGSAGREQSGAAKRAKSKGS